MLFSFTINGRPVDPSVIFRNQRFNNSTNNFHNTSNINQYQMDYIKRYGYPQTCIDRMKMKEYEKTMREITIIDDIEIKDPFEKKEVIISNISGNQV